MVLENKIKMLFQISHAGQSPPVLGFPGSLADISTIPPVMQNLFHPCNIADCTCFVSA